MTSVFIFSKVISPQSKKSFTSHSFRLMARGFGNTQRPVTIDLVIGRSVSRSEQIAMNSSFLYLAYLSIINFMQIKKVLKYCKDLISKAEVSKAIDTFCTTIKVSKQVKTEILLISYRFNQIKKDFLSGIIAYDQYAIENNKIARNLLAEIENFENKKN
ncbi:MAG: hypothetical protein R2824_08405 [Saprospiraceae bacterium]